MMIDEPVPGLLVELLNRSERDEMEGEVVVDEIL
jgi:hypothetical protein